jgi:hypothetical protein
MCITSHDSALRPRGGRVLQCRTDRELPGTVRTHRTGNSRCRGRASLRPGQAQAPISTESEAAEIQPGAAQVGAHRGFGAAPSQRSSTEILERLKRARSARDAADAELDALFDRAVGLGVGWPEIAEQLGVTRQAARQRYQRRHGSA